MAFAQQQSFFKGKPCVLWSCSWAPEEQTELNTGEEPEEEK